MSQSTLYPQQASRPRAANCVSCGFTLIELLSVIAVIGILMTILIPVIGYVRDAGQLSKATSELRQLNSTILLYSVSENGDFPVGYVDIPTEGTNYERAGHVWYEAAGRILYPEIRENLEKPWMWRFHPTGYEGTVFMSPAAEPDASSQIPSYGYNDSLYRKAGNSRKLQLFFAPEKTALLGDCSGRTHSLSPDFPDGNLNARHGASAPYAGDGKAVVGYMDGHVEVLDSERCQELNSSPTDAFWGERL